MPIIVYITSIIDFIVMPEKIHDFGEKATFYSTQVLKAQRFYLDMHGRQPEGVSVVSGGCEHCKPDFCIDRSDFPFYSIEFVARGKGDLAFDTQCHGLMAGTVFTYGPKIPHMITTDPKDCLVKYFIDFTGTQAQSLLADCGLTPGQVVHVASPNQIVNIFDDLILNGQTVNRYNHQLCATLLKYLALKIAATVVSKEVVRSAAYTTYQTCCEYILENCMTLQSLGQIAEACHIDEAYLCRLFKRFGEHSPYQHLVRLKMNVAAVRLQDPKALIKEIAFEAGFSSTFHFSRAFKKIFGISPDTFRCLR